MNLIMVFSKNWNTCCQGTSTENRMGNMAGFADFRTNGSTMVLCVCVQVRNMRCRLILNEILINFTKICKE